MEKQSKNKAIVLFKGNQIRRHYDEEKELWYFSIIDIIQILTGSSIPKRYWSDLRNKLNKEGCQPYDKIVRLKMVSEDGKMRETDVADTETMLRIIQSIPSPKAEPFKVWLAKVGYERIQETTDPERSINRGRANWQKMGHSQKWIQQRMMGQEIRNKLTDYWKDNEVKEKDEYAILTNLIHQEWSDLSIKEHKNLKKLKTENLRDHMTDAELVFSSLAELSTRQIAEAVKAKGLEENKIPAIKGGQIAKNARLELEQKTGKKVVSKSNFKSIGNKKLKQLN